MHRDKAKLTKPAFFEVMYLFEGQDGGCKTVKVMSVVPKFLKFSWFFTFLNFEFSMKSIWDALETFVT